MGACRIVVILGTRPEAIKLFPVIHALQSMPGLRLCVCATGQHREAADAVLAFAGIVPDIVLETLPPGQTLDALTAHLVTALGAVLDAGQPDRVIVQGDTASAKAAALAAYYRRIPVDHVEAGLRSGNLNHPWPEEGNRRIITALADRHFAPTQAAALALRREGIAPAAIHLTGNTVIDALLATRARLRAGGAGIERIAALQARFAGRRIVAVTCHRRENWGEGLANLIAALREIARRDDAAILFPVHPNPALRALVEAELAGLAHVALLGPLAYPEFVALLDASHIVLTDSGGVQEEAPALGKPVLVLRETTERPEGVAAGTALLVGTDRDRIVREVARLLDDHAAWQAMARPHFPYGDGQASRRIAEVLAGMVGDAGETSLQQEG